MKRLWARLRKFGTTPDGKRNILGAALDLSAAIVLAPYRVAGVTWGMATCLVSDTEEFKAQCHYYGRRCWSTLGAIFGIKMTYWTDDQGRWQRKVDWESASTLALCGGFGFLFGGIAQMSGSILVYAALTFGPYVVAFIANFGSAVRAWNAMTFSEYKRAVAMAAAKQTINQRTRKAYEADEAVELAYELKNLEAEAADVDARALRALILLEDAGAEIDDTLLALREEDPEQYARLRSEADAMKALETDDEDDVEDANVIKYLELEKEE